MTTLDDVAGYGKGTAKKGGATRSPRRVLVVDFNHMAYKYVHGMGVRLTKNITDPQTGELRTVVTNVPNGVGKSLHKWSRGGYDILAVCLDRPQKSRRELFHFLRPSDKVGYKGSRSGMNDKLFEAMQLTVQMLQKSGIACYAGNDYEADDLIKAVIDKCKVDYPGMPIDVVTGDADLVPLVDDTVSVFLSSRTGTYAVSKDIEKTKYKQITPDNYEEVVSSLSAYKAYKGGVPYNSLLLIKMLRGDSSDNIPGVTSKSLTPTRVSGIIEDMQRIGIDMANVFRYGGDVNEMVITLMPYLLDERLLDDLYNEVLEQDVLPEVFDKYFNLTEYGMELAARGQEFDSEDNVTKGWMKDKHGGLIDLSEVMKNYLIMNLNQTIEIDRDGETVTLRKSTGVSTPKPFDEIKMAHEFQYLGIQIPVGRW